MTAGAVVIASVTRLISRGQYARAVTTICASTWGAALGVTWIAPVTFPLMVLTAQMPVILALPYVPPRRLRVFMVVTVGCVVGLAMLARLQDISGLSVQIPDLLQDIVMIVSLPVLAGSVLLIVGHNSAVLIASRRLLACRAEELHQFRTYAQTELVHGGVP
jgi:hypothetical protein